MQTCGSSGGGGVSSLIESLGAENATLPVLIQALEHDEMLVRWVAASELEKMGPEAAEATPALTQVLGDELEVRWAASKALVQIGPEAVPPLIQAMGDGNYLARKWAAYALGNIGPGAKESVPTLIRALGDEDYDVVRWVAEALARITGQHFGEDANLWQHWWEEQQ